MNLIEKIAANHFEKTGSIKKMTVAGFTNNMWDVYRIPLDELYYNDKNGRINTAYKQYKAEHGMLTPEPGNSEYNEIFEEFIYDSNKGAMDETLRSIEETTQQEPGVVLLDGRVIDGNRRLTALRRIERKNGIKQTFDAIVLPLDYTTAYNEKHIKELELELQLGREERVAYDTIDRIFDVYNTIEVEKLMTADEYKKASGAGNTKGINRDIRLAKLMIKFIEIISPGGDPIDKFYLARELKIDGPIEEIEGTINKLKTDKESITDAALTYLAVTKAKDGNADHTRLMRDVKNNVLKKDDIKKHFLEAVDDKVDDIIDAFEEHPIKSGNDLKTLIHSTPELEQTAEKLSQSVESLSLRGERNSKRRESLEELKDILERLEEIDPNDFEDLTKDEYEEAKEILQNIRDAAYKLRGK